MQRYSDSLITLEPSRGSSGPELEEEGAKLNNDLVIRALNYHGQQLTSFMKENSMHKCIDLKTDDYHLYHQVGVRSALPI